MTDKQFNQTFKYMQAEFVKLNERMDSSGKKSMACEGLITSVGRLVSCNRVERNCGAKWRIRVPLWIGFE